jgi:4-carboxymuconolactone decarboxylase
MAHLPFDPEKLSPSNRSMYEEIVARRHSKGTHFNGPFDALMNHPALCQRIEQMGYYLKFQGLLPRDLYQFLVLCISVETGDQFMWNDHEQDAMRDGVPSEVIETIRREGFLKGSFPDSFQLVADILKYTFFWKNVPEEIQNKFIHLYGQDRFVELVVLSGFYQMFAAINQGFDVKSL